MLAYLFVILAVGLRFLPHPWAFTPVGAALLFFGASRPRKQFVIPVVLLAASDYYLTVYHYGYPFDASHVVTLAWYVLICLLGIMLKHRVTVARVVGAALSTSISFFLLSNFAVWAFGTMYPKSPAGLLQCYVMGLPFFPNQIAADLLFTGAIFSVAALAVSGRLPASKRRDQLES